MTRSIFRILFLAVIFQFFYFSFLYFIEDVSFYLPILMLLALGVLYPFLFEDKKFKLADYLLVFKVGMVLMIIVFAYILYKVFYLSLGYSL